MEPALSLGRNWQAAKRVPLRVLGVFASALLFVWLAFGAAAFAADNLLKNGDFESGGAGGQPFADWTAYRWEGDGEVVLGDGVSFSGRRSAIIRGTGPGKVAVFQAVTLPACSYRLSAMVAGYDIVPGTWNFAAHMLVALDDGTNLLHPVLTGDSGWRRMNLGFKVAAERKATIYFFNYGSGSFFVDDVRLEADQPCGGTLPGFSVSVAMSKPLDYTPPPTPQDRLLAGFCSRPDYGDRPVCRRVQGTVAASTEVRATSPRPIADFVSLVPFHRPSILPLRKTWHMRAAGASLKPAAVLPAGTALVGEPSVGLPADWRGYDWLEIDVENTAKSVQTLTIEIRDDKTTDYWSRVNWDTSVPPGRTTAYIPLQAFVGEKSVIQQRRRLDLEKITRLVLSTAEGGPDIAVEALRLAPEPPNTSEFPELIKLDAGPPAAPVASGFTPLLASTRYRPERGWGLSADAKIGREEDRRHPDDLLRDWISFNKGGLDFDLPNDTYHVWMMLEDPGYWEYYPSFKARTVSAEGHVVLDDRRNANDFLTRYFRHADDEDLPGDDTWSRYIKSRYRPLEFDVEVKDGQLNLRFDSFEDPHAVPLSALIIYPTSQAARGQAFVGDLWARLKRGFDRETVQIRPVLPPYPKPAGNALGGALSVFQRPIETDVNATDWPAESELVSAISLPLARDERSILPVSLYAQSDIEITQVQLQLPGIEHAGYKVRYRFIRANADGSVYASSPSVLDPLVVSAEQPLLLRAGTTRSLWFDVHAPADARPDRVEGRLRLQFRDGRAHEIPVTVDVAPWLLPQADIPIGYLGDAPSYAGTRYPEVAQKRLAEMRQSLKLLKENGFTAFTGGLSGPSFDGYVNGRPRIDFAAADRSIEAIETITHVTELNTYGGLEITGLPSDPRRDTLSEFKKPYVQVLHDVLWSVSEHGLQHHWPALLHSIGDEPQGDDIERVAALGRAFKQSGTNNRTAAFTSLRKPSDPAAKLAGAIDRLYLNIHTEAAIRFVRDHGSECSLYNQVGRYRRGIYLMKAKQLGCPGMLRFALSSVHADPWFDLDGRESDYSALFAHPDGLRIAVEFMRFRQSVTDYRCLLALETQIAAAAQGPAASAAKRWLDDLTAGMSADAGTDAAWGPHRLDEIRQTARGHLERLGATHSSAAKAERLPK